MSSSGSTFSVHPPHSTPPADSMLVEVNFSTGPLGLTLHRHQNGIVSVVRIMDGSQSSSLDVLDGDELWEVEGIRIDERPLDEAAWQRIGDLVRHTRPLKVVFRRHLLVLKNDLCCREDF